MQTNMWRLTTRILKRLAVLAAGAFFVYLAVWHIFPFFDNRVPAALALFVTYVVTAYILIPLTFRLFRLFYNPVHLPLYCTTPDGFASDPINIALSGTRQQAIRAMEAAEWHMADPKTPQNVLRQIASTILARSYPNAPMSSLYLFGRKQDLAFEKEIPGTRGYRHHVRFWATDANLAKEFEEHVQFWRRFHRPNRRRPHAYLWVGAASKDIGFAPIRHNAQVTHAVDPDTASERKLIVHDLRKAHQLTGNHTLGVHQPFSLRNRALRSSLKSDGQITVCNLK